MKSTLNDKIKHLLTSENKRTLQLKQNIIGSLFLKCINILITLQVVPLTIDYINATRYGIWLTLSSIIAWLSYFDLGFAHGFRNRFAEAKANNNIKLAREYVSTTYFVLIIIFSIIFIVSFFINSYLNWGNILNIDKSYNEELRLVFVILACFFCLNIIANIFTIMLVADQKTASSSLIHTSGQFLAYVCIYILTKTTSGNLVYLALAYSGIPCLFIILVSIIMYSSNKYKNVSPHLRYIRLNLVKKIIGLGGQFFIIMISMLFIFQLINIILSRIEGPEIVTQYNIAFKYLNVLNMIMVIILAPFWSAFTEAYVKKDFLWMKSMVRKLEITWLICIPIITLMLLLSDFVYEWWIGNSIHIPFTLSLCVSIYILSQTLGNIYMYMINGTSKVRLQMIIYIVFALVSIPIMTLSCKIYGVEGILLIPTVVYLFQAIVGRIQIYKIINGKAKGIWLK